MFLLRALCIVKEHSYTLLVVVKTVKDSNFLDILKGGEVLLKTGLELRVSLLYDYLWLMVVGECFAEVRCHEVKVLFVFFHDEGET